MSNVNGIDEWFSTEANDHEYEERVASVTAKDHATHNAIYLSFPNDNDVDMGERMKMHLEIARSHIVAFEHEKKRRLTHADVCAILRYIGYERGVN